MKCFPRIMANLARTHIPRLVVLSSFALALSGCRVIGGIFKAGVWVGALAVIVVIGLVLWGIKAMMSR